MKSAEFPMMKELQSATREQMSFYNKMMAKKEMNKRILQLAKQAGLKFPSEEALSPVEIKFAELIVRECMGICYRTDTEYEGHKVKSTVIASKVAEHFGVEE